MTAIYHNLDHQQLTNAVKGISKPFHIQLTYGRKTRTGMMVGNKQNREASRMMVVDKCNREASPFYW